MGNGYYRRGGRPLADKRGSPDIREESPHRGRANSMKRRITTWQF